jgi:hypothetical protein
MLNPLSLDGGRWYGIGNVSFAAYATAGLVLAGYLAYRGRSVGHPRAGLVVAAAVGLVVILSDGWPSMGADFGGVVTLTPALIWLLFRLSDRPVRMRRLVLTTAAAVLAVSAISVLDWLRGPNSRTHLGNFVQRMIVGDAGPLLLRKGVAVAQSIGTLWGVVSIVLGILLWVVVFTRMLRVSNGFGTIRHVAVAVLMTAVVGSLLNDSGVIVWTIVTASFFITVASWWTDKALEAHCAPLIPGHDARDPAT